MIKPKQLKRGDKIVILAPSSGLGKIFPHRVTNATKALRNLGFEVELKPSTKKSIDGRGGTVKERIDEIHDAFSDSAVSAIICMIGGIHCNELLPHLDYELISGNPTILCGYSDITMLHSAISRKTQLVTFYGPMAMTQFAENPEPLKYTLDSFKKVLMNNEEISKVYPSTNWTDEFLDWGQKKDLERPRKKTKNKGYFWLKDGGACGEIVGGCLNSLVKLTGTEYCYDYKGKILFVENSEADDPSRGVNLSTVDSQITDLKNSGVFDKIAGLIVGRPFGYNSDERDRFRKIIEKHVKSSDFPVLFNVDIGHTDPIITLPINLTVSLDSSKNKFIIKENAVI